MDKNESRENSNNTIPTYYQRQVSAPQNSFEEMAEENGITAAVDELVTFDELIKLDEEREDTALALLGGSLDLVCTYSEGYKIRQPLYSCKTCYEKTGQLAGICYACSENCHDGHDLVEMYSKRRFCCDCGNAKFETKCKLFEEKDAFNKQNKYNDNFKGIFCSCKKQYPPDENDATASEEDMVQCCMCEDWFHLSHIFPFAADQQCTIEEAGKCHSDDTDNECLICKNCMANFSFLAFYTLSNGPSEELSTNQSKSIEEKEKERDECKLEAIRKKKNSIGNVEDNAKSVWVKDGWQEELCRCKKCMNLYEDLDCSFLMDPEDTLSNFEKQNREKAAAQNYEAKDLYQMVVEETKERETALKVMEGIEQMKHHCKQFFEKRAAEKRGPITGEDVEQCFAELRAKRIKLEEEPQQNEQLNTPGNGPWTQGRHKKTQKFRNKLQKLIKPTDDRIKDEIRLVKRRKVDENALKVKEAPKISAAMFLKYNTQLGPPFHVIIDTNFVNFSIKNRIDIMTGFMDCLYAKVVPYISDCVLGELEKMGRRFKLALKIIKDSRFQRLQCSHKGIYADDCIIQRVTQHKCYIVATCDKDLRQRIRKIPGVPIMYIRDHRFTIERMPDAYGAPKLG